MVEDVAHLAGVEGPPWRGVAEVAVLDGTSQPDHETTLGDEIQLYSGYPFLASAINTAL